MLEKVKFKLRVTNYLVMSGASQEEVEWRSQSVKGLMRWWFRAAGGNVDEEKRIFGHGGDKANASLFQLRCSPLKFKNEEIKNTQQIWGNLSGGEKYLGYSIKIGERKAVKPNTEFFVDIRFYPSVKEKDKRIVLTSLWLAVNLGNFGTRARRGFGSIEFCECSDVDFCKELKFLKDGEIKQWYKRNLSFIAQSIGADLKLEVYHTNKSLGDVGEEYKKLYCSP